MLQPGFHTKGSLEAEAEKGGKWLTKRNIYSWGGRLLFPVVPIIEPCTCWHWFYPIHLQSLYFCSHAYLHKYLPGLYVAQNMWLARLLPTYPAYRVRHPSKKNVQLNISPKSIKMSACRNSKSTKMEFVCQGTMGRCQISENTANTLGHDNGINMVYSEGFQLQSFRHPVLVKM